MFNQNKDQVTKNAQEERKKKPTYWERVIQGKGTVSEPWPTAEELWNDPEVQKSIQNHNQSVEKKKFKRYMKLLKNAKKHKVTYQ